VAWHRSYARDPDLHMGRGPHSGRDAVPPASGLMSVIVWAMVGIALWHFAVLVPDRFWGGIIGAFLAAVAGALAGGYALPSPGIPADNPPGVQEALWAVPGAALALCASWIYGDRRERENDAR
jgi:hypothetical protein